MAGCLSLSYLSLIKPGKSKAKRLQKWSHGRKYITRVSVTYDAEIKFSLSDTDRELVSDSMHSAD